MLARNSDLYFEVSESSVAFSSSARLACSISWFLRSTRRCVRQAAEPFARLLVGLLQFFFAGSELSGELLGLLQAGLRSAGGFDTVEHDADAVVSCSRKSFAKS